MEVINENDANVTAIHKTIKRIYVICRRKEKGARMTVLVGDQPKFKLLFRIFSDSLEHGVTT